MKGFAPFSHTAEDLKVYFSNFGVDVRNIKLTPHGNAALVSFTDRDAAKKLKEAAQGAILDGRPLEISYFEPKEVRMLH